MDFLTYFMDFLAGWLDGLLASLLACWLTCCVSESLAGWFDLLWRCAVGLGPGSQNVGLMASKRALGMRRVCAARQKGTRRFQATKSIPWARRHFILTIFLSTY